MFITDEYEIEGSNESEYIPPDNLGNKSSASAVAGDTAFEKINTLNSQLSHVGMIIQSTTLDTEAKVKAIYGSNTSWIKHSGYVLRGATSGVVANQASNDGGADSVTVSSVASHNHTQNSHNHDQNSHDHSISLWQNGQHYYGSSGSLLQWYSNMYGSQSPKVSGTTATNKAATATNIANGSNYTVNTLPKYKNVYIWERTA